MFLGILFIKVLTSGSLDFKFAYYACAKVCIYCVTSSGNKMLFKINMVPASRKLHFNWKKKKTNTGDHFENWYLLWNKQILIGSHEFLYKRDNWAETERKGGTKVEQGKLQEKRPWGHDGLKSSQGKKEGQCRQRKVNISNNQNIGKGVNHVT